MRPFARIYDVVSHVPKGKVLTYQAVATLARVANPRIVGFALHSNRDPKNIPCHRVIKSNGAIAKGYAFGGPAKQQETLQKEGVQFLSSGRVNLSKSLFNPS